MYRFVNVPFALLDAFGESQNGDQGVLEIVNDRRCHLSNAGKVTIFFPLSSLLSFAVNKETCKKCKYPRKEQMQEAIQKSERRGCPNPEEERRVCQRDNPVAPKRTFETEAEDPQKKRDV